ncbi:MAG: 23S rRNA (pseudouridine(1915)-N(3))-methyltransferase RlmH [Lachnospiraceae bacterium]|nr:23S rRNA (pseudouridine(1915)-N(3))-methyltransferase RlmH [Lachnospiraceae bacterium]
MTITILCVGKIKEKFYSDAVSEYAKRLSRYAKISIAEVKDEKTPDQASEKEEQEILKKEGERLLSRMPDNAYVIALAIKGKSYDSIGMAEHLEKLSVNGNSSLVFVIGGSLGLSEEVLNRADEHWSFSALTFPHQLMRVILLEQLYRSYRIRNHEPYHK